MPKESFRSRLRHAWNAFSNRDPTYISERGYYYRPDRPRFSRGNERSIVTSVYNRISLDCTSIDIKHVVLDDNDRYIDTVDSGLNYCLSQEANIDQTGRAFRQDIYMSLIDEGSVGIVPVETTLNPKNTMSYDIKSMRTGKIIEWMPKHVKMLVYNENTGKKEEIILPKSTVAIVENPFYSIMNEPNSTLQRLIRKLSLMDSVDELSSSGKIDMIIQLPYVLKGELKKKQAEERRKQIEDQLAGSEYGIAYIDGTEHITQLNRSIDNNLLKQVEYLTTTLYSQLGITTTILDGTADEKTMINYQNRIIEPIVSAVIDEMNRKFLSKTARTQGQSIVMFNNAFKLVPISEIAEIADKFTRNEIYTPNEIRQILGSKPSTDPQADQLRNRNISSSNNEYGADQQQYVVDEGQYSTEEYPIEEQYSE